MKHEPCIVLKEIYRTIEKKNNERYNICDTICSGIKPIMNKYIDKIKESPPRNDITMDELKTAMTSLGFKFRNCSGSHVVFMHKERHDLYASVPSPHGGKKGIKPVYIKNIQKLIEELEE